MRRSLLWFLYPPFGNQHGRILRPGKRCNGLLLDLEGWGLFDLAQRTKSMLLLKYLANKVKWLYESFLKRFTSNVSPRKTQKVSRSICADRLFPTLEEASGCVTSEVFGVLPKDQGHRCLLRSECIRSTPGVLEAFRAEKKNTHQFWGWVQKRHSDKVPGTLIYYIQMDLSHESQKSGNTLLRPGKRRNADLQRDACSVFINRCLARLVLRHSGGKGLMLSDDEFWCLAIERAYRSYWRKENQPN